MTSAYLPELFASDKATCTVVQDAAIARALSAVIKRLGEQRHSRLGHLHHTEFQLVLVRLDHLADKPGFEDLHSPLLADWRVWYSAHERELDSIAYRPVPGGKEIFKVAEGSR